MTSSGLEAANEFMPFVLTERLYFSRWSEFSAVDKTGLALLVSHACKLYIFFQNSVFCF